MGTVTASDGVVIRYQEMGSGRPILLLHGLMAHGGFFRAQSRLASDYRLIVLDFRGHGTARAEGEGATVERLALDAAELSAALDLHDAIVIGWSLGATIMWHLLAGSASGRFSGGMAIDMTPQVTNGHGWSLGLTRERCDDRLRAMTDDYPAFAMAAGEAIFAPDFADAGLKEWAGHEFARNDSASIAGLWTSLTAQNLRPVLGLIRHPMIVVHGGQSHLYGPETARYLIDHMPDAQAVEFPGCGHSPHLEAPDAFNALVRDFEGRLKSKSDAKIETGEK